MNANKNTQGVKHVDDTEEKSVVISGYLTHLQHRPLLPSVWRNRFWVLRSDGSLYCFRHASSKVALIKFDLADPSIRIRTGEPVSELKGVKWPRGVFNDRKLCLKLKKKCFFFYTSNSTQLSAWDESLHSASDKFAFGSNWTLSSHRGKLSASEAPNASVHDMRGGEMKGVEAEDKEALLESYRQRKSVMARAQLATLFGSQPSPSISRVSNFGDKGDMEPLSQRVQRLSDASSTVVTLKRRPSKAREVEKVHAPVEEYGAFTFQPRAGAPPLSPSPLPDPVPKPEVSDRQRKTSHSQPKPTQTELSLAKRGEEEVEKNFLTKMERFRQLATQHELPLRTAGDLQRINRNPQRIRIPNQFMLPSDTPPPSPPRAGHRPQIRSYKMGSNLSSIKERMQPSGPGRHSPNLPPRGARAKNRLLALRAAEQNYAAKMDTSRQLSGEESVSSERGEKTPIILPPQAFLLNPNVSQDTVRRQEESLNEFKQMLSEYSQPSEEKLIPPVMGEDTELPSVGNSASPGFPSKHSDRSSEENVTSLLQTEHIKESAEGVGKLTSHFKSEHSEGLRSEDKERPSGEKMTSLFKNDQIKTASKGAEKLTSLFKSEQSVDPIEDRFAPPVRTEDSDIFSEKKMTSLVKGNRIRKASKGVGELTSLLKSDQSEGLIEDKFASPIRSEDSDRLSEENLRTKLPSFTSMRKQAIKLEENLAETRPTRPWRRAVPPAPSKSPLAREAPFNFSQDGTVPVPSAQATRSLPLPASRADAQGRQVVKGEDPAEEAKQDRVQKAVDWVGGEVQKLIGEIRRLGATAPGGRCKVEFGLLFSETADQFDALTGILKTAKKLGVLSYEGEVLFQGVDDRKLITLLRQDLGEVSKEMLIRTPPVSPRSQRVGGSPPGKHRKFGAGTQQYGQNSCAVCGKPVYQMEFVGATDKAFHRWCFRCCVCRITLSPTNFATIADKYYCTVHYERAYLSAGGYRELEGGPN